MLRKSIRSLARAADQIVFVEHGAWGRSQLQGALAKSGLPLVIDHRRQIHLTGADRTEVKVGGVTFGLETGRLARLAAGAVVCDTGDTAVLAAITSGFGPAEDKGNLPLQIDYREREYALGRIPATFTRREGQPKDREIVVARAIDRAVRPLFPPGYLYETQIQASTLCADGTQDPDILSINAASAALMCSDVPWNGPVGAVRVCIVNGEVKVNPTQAELQAAQATILYVGTATRTVTVEAQAKGPGVTNAQFAEALRVAHVNALLLLEPQRQLAAAAGAPKRKSRLTVPSPDLLQKGRDIVGAFLRESFNRGAQTTKKSRGDEVRFARGQLATGLAAKGIVLPPIALGALFDSLAAAEVRRMALDDGVRLDGRALGEVRPLTCESGVLPRVHGSSIFERGETQALVTVTVGALEEAQRTEDLGVSGSKRLMVHYVFPPFSVNDTGKSQGLSRREIGHGNLAERALAGALPGEDAFPFCVRVNSETLQSNGSSAMAAVCAGSMALMDAGVPLQSHVAGVSIGLVTEEDAASGSVTRHALLTDIQGSEDHWGEMDFKVAGTRNGITAVQLDVKHPGVPLELVISALEPALAARTEIIDAMTGEIAAARAELRATTPRFHSIVVEKEDIGKLIGPGGSVVKDIERRTECKLSFDQSSPTSSAKVAIFAPGAEALDAARAIIDRILGASTRPGTAYSGRVVSLKDFGAIVELANGDQGLLHISEVAHERTYRIEDALALDDEVEVMVLAKDARGSLKARKEVLSLSIKALLPPPAGTAAAAGAPQPPSPPRQSGVVRSEGGYVTRRSAAGGGAAGGASGAGGNPDSR